MFDSCLLLSDLKSNLFIGSEKNKKRDLNQYYRSNERTDYKSNLPGRGDIPIIHGDCDGKNINVH